jgi:hypothetical protein
MKRGRWTEIYTRRTKDIPHDMEISEGKNHGQGWACTCGCGKRIWGRKHSDGPPKEECQDGFVPATGGASEAFRNNYDLIDWSVK